MMTRAFTLNIGRFLLKCLRKKLAFNQARERKRANLVRGDIPGFVFCSEE